MYILLGILYILAAIVIWFVLAASQVEQAPKPYDGLKHILWAAAWPLTLLIMVLTD